MALDEWAPVLRRGYGTISIMTPNDLRLLPAERVAELPPLTQALWHDAHGNWERAHEIAQEIESLEAARVHAYLHRKEGDAFNAAYWYRRAGVPVFSGSLNEEWSAMVAALHSS